MHNSKILIFALTLVGAGGLGACGGDDDDADAAPPPIDAANAVDASTTVDATPDAAVDELVLIAAARNGDIYLIDETTGVETLLLDTFTMDDTPAAVDVGVISAMEWIESKGELWAGTGGHATRTGVIQLVNPTTGELTTFASIAPGNGVPGLSLRPADGFMYATLGDSEGIMKIDTDTGGVTNIGGTAGGAGNGIAFAADDTLYVTRYFGTENLHTADPANGNIITDTLLTYSGFPTFNDGNPRVRTLAIRPTDGTLFSIVGDGSSRDGQNPAIFVVTIDPATGVVTNLHETTVKLDGFAFVPMSFFGL